MALRLRAALPLPPCTDRGLCCDHRRRRRHGQFHDLQRMFKRLGRPGSDGKVWLFLGDYIDRGEWFAAAGPAELACCRPGGAGQPAGGGSGACWWAACITHPGLTLGSPSTPYPGPMGLEIVATLLALKLRHPASIHLLRGNHECSEITVLFGFCSECQRRSTLAAWEAVMQVGVWVGGGPSHSRPRAAQQGCGRQRAGTSIQRCSLSLGPTAEPLDAVHRNRRPALPALPPTPPAGL